MEEALKNAEKDKKEMKMFIEEERKMERENRRRIEMLNRK